MTPFLIKIDRISCRVNPRSFLDWIKKKKPMEVEDAFFLDDGARRCINQRSSIGDDAAHALATTIERHRRGRPASTSRSRRFDFEDAGKMNSKA